MIKTDRSEALYTVAKTYFPGGVNSPVRAFRGVGGTPLFIKKGKGSRIYDADENSYIDYCCSWGPLILGHCNAEVEASIINAVKDGTSFGAPTEAENELAKLITENHPVIKKMRFVSSGTEAVMSAIRLARGYTKRDKIIKFEGCFHGHSDSLLVKAGSGLATFGISSSAGVPESLAQHTIVLPLDDEQALKEAFAKHKNEIACVIIEPIPANNGLLLQRKEYLQFLRDICSAEGTLLIFDEVISGFRVGFTGATGYYSIKADIVTLGKIIGGGMPVGAYGASAEIMSSISPEGNVYQAGTLSGNPVAMKAGVAQLSQCLKPGFYEALEKRTQRLVTGVSSYLAQKNYPASITGIHSIYWIWFTKNEVRKSSDIDAESMKHFSKFFHSLLAKGIYLGPSGYEVGFVSAAHTDEDIDRTIEAFKTSLDEVFG